MKQDQVTRPKSEMADVLKDIEAIHAHSISAISALMEARSAGLLQGEKDAHVSFRVPRALFEAARRRSGVQSMTEVGTLALALLAQEDPVSDYMKQTRGALGPDHKLEY